MRKSLARTSLWRAAVVVLAAVVLAGCAARSHEASTPIDNAAVQVVAFNTSELGWSETLPALADTPAGSGITLAPTYGASGNQLQAVLAGKPADIVHFAAQPDMTALVRAGLVSPDWNTGPAAGIPVGSMVVWVVRKGNPHNIAGWTDLLQPGLEVVTPSPVAVGSGRWALLAGYAATSNGNQNPDVGRDYLRRLILEHVAQGPTTVHAAIDQFVQGRGDVLLVSEAVALNMVRQGKPVEHIVPPATLKMEFPVAVTTSGHHHDEAKRVIDFLYSDAGQRIWAGQGFRPTNPAIAAEDAAQSPLPETLWTIDDLGGWNQVGPRFFDATNGYVTKLFHQATQ